MFDGGKPYQLVKPQRNAESAANDAENVRLRAFRFEKEARDAKAARPNPQPAPISRSKTHGKSNG